MIKLKVGDLAPDSQGITQPGEKVCLKDYLGKELVLYFYPKDNTPGCTAGACSLRDNFQDIKDKGVEILGVSPDSEASHKKFIENHVLPFDLIPDIEKKIIRDYGAWGMKKVDTKNHAQQILAVLTK
jgi:peroxiredoxin Q/BCP